MDGWTKRERFFCIVSAILFIACIGMVMLYYNKTETVQLSLKDAGELQKEMGYQPEVSQQEPEDKEPKKIMVHVKGQVRNPGVVVLDEGKRVWDAVKTAGGALDTADLNAVSLALPLRDGQDVYIPAKGEVDNYSQMALAHGTMNEKDSRININTADEDELMKLPGIGPATSKKIIDFREQNGGFKKIEDIKNVPGIGDKKFEQIKDLIDVY
ncbi:MAG: hypothetical protein GX066_01175 [Clostridiaceae bacterium]|nr:hypothetical protein [Clostridiaceae bacterium]